MNDIRDDLALAYLIISHLKMDDHTYTHISARPENAGYFYILPFGLRFEEATAENLLKVSLEGKILGDNKEGYNITGYVTHSSIYKSRSDINAIFHLHTPATVAVSSIAEGLMPINQWAMHFYEKVSYAKYNSLILENDNGDDTAKSLGDNYVMLLQNHGSITCGRDIQEALFYTYHLEQACNTQVQTLGMGKNVIYPAKEILEKTVSDLLSFEPKLGHRDWKAWKRKLVK